MRRTLFISILLALAGCSSQRHAMTTDTTVDSVKVVVQEKTIYRDTVIFVEVPVESDKAILPMADTSHLETSMAISDAWLSEGRLNHTLINKDVNIKKPIKVPEVHKDIQTDHVVNRVVEKVVEVEVEKELNKWQIFRMMLGTITLIAIGLFVAFKLIKWLWFNYR